MKEKNVRIPKPIIEFNPPSYICKRADKPFVLDGNINKDFWRDAPFTEDFKDIEGVSKPTPRFRTRAKMLWDDNSIYFALLLEGDEIWATVTERDDVIFRDNDIEIFIDPDSDTCQYYEFEMNALNTVWDLFLTKPYRDMGLAINAWDIKGLKTAVHINGKLNDPTAANKSWSVEVVMPFVSLKECAIEKRIPKEGEYWRINFSRVQWLVDILDGTYKKRINPQTNSPFPEDNWVWSPTGVINMHYPELWGFVFFSNIDSSKGTDITYTIPMDEKIKYQLRTLYYAEHRYYDEHGKYTNNFNLLKDIPDDIPNVIIETTKNSFEIRCLNFDGTKEISIFSDSRIVIQ
jgi:hypothetical protein